MTTNDKSWAAKMLQNGTVFSEEIKALGYEERNLYSLLKAKLKTVKIDGEDLYIAEGDTLLDEAQLEIYSLEKEASNNATRFQIISDKAGLGRFALINGRERGITGMTQNGRLVRWKPGLILRYCILKKTFVSGFGNYDLVRNNFERAVNEWENTCGIQFEYAKDLDNTTNTDPDDIGVTFVVREFDAGGNFIASAFFPNDPSYRRRVLIDPSYFTNNGFDQIGVLRHELGNVLGFRHEHIRPEAPHPCFNEDLTETHSLTAYDSASVMHYLCGGHGDPKLNITSLDKQGAQLLYGPPIKALQFIP